MKLLLLAMAISCVLSAQDDGPATSTRTSGGTPAAPPAPAREQARSMIVTQYGIVAASQFLASQAGAKMLEQGGNAIDAAIAANAVLGLTQPYVNGMGGDLFAIVYEAKTGKVYGLNSSGWTPKALTIEYLKSKGIDKIDRTGVHTITVPGCVAGWDALRKRFGAQCPLRLTSPTTTPSVQRWMPQAVPDRCAPSCAAPESAMSNDCSAKAEPTIPPASGGFLRSTCSGRSMSFVTRRA